MMTHDYETVNSSLDENGIRTLLLNRPQSLNAMNRQLLREVTQAFDAANADDATRVIVFSGMGSAFCAGDDRHEHQHPQSREEAQEFVELIQGATRAIVLGAKPVVGAINGWAVGGGLEWAINCDFPIWAQSAKGFFPEVALNLFVTGGVSALLPAMVGLNRAREMLYLGERYDAQALLEMGVAWRVVDDDELMASAMETAGSLARQPQRSLQAMKRVLRQTSSADFERALALETEATVDGFMDPLTTTLLKDF
jgi:enoyl-CoA hydratase/carnithine racemase